MDESAEKLNPLFTWRAHPAMERKAHALAGAAVILLVGAVVYLMVLTDGVATVTAAAWAGLSIIVLALTLNRFFLPSRFSIDEDGITAAFPLRSRRFRWTEIRRFTHDRHGGYLSRRARRSRLDAYSGLHILFGSRDDEVIEQIRAHIQSGEA